MKAIVLQSSKENDFKMLDVKRPQINDDEFLLKVEALGLGVHDGEFFPRTIDYPYVIGIEAAGTVLELGKNVSNYKKGDRLAVVSMMQEKGGVWAEYAAVSKDSLIVEIPEKMSFEHAAAVLVAGNTVLKALAALDLQAGDHLFVVGGSGAIGTFAIQLAHKMGVIVSASASLENSDYMKRLGATITVDYKDPFWIKKMNEVRPEGQDAVLAIPRNTSTESMKVLKDNGKLLSVSYDQLSPQSRVKVLEIPYGLNVQEDLEALMKQLASGELHLEIESVVPFEDAISTLLLKAKQHARGKTVITMKGLND